VRLPVQAHALSPLTLPYQRRLEMMNLMIGFEQNNQFFPTLPAPIPLTIMQHHTHTFACTQSTVRLAPSSATLSKILQVASPLPPPPPSSLTPPPTPPHPPAGLGAMLSRNVLHTHRPFTARVMDPQVPLARVIFVLRCFLCCFARLKHASAPAHVSTRKQGNIIMKIQRGFFFFKSSLTGAPPSSRAASLFGPARCKSLNLAAIAHSCCNRSSLLLPPSGAP